MSIISSAKDVCCTTDSIQSMSQDDRLYVGIITEIVRLFAVLIEFNCIYSDFLVSWKNDLCKLGKSGVKTCFVIIARQKL